MVWDLAWKLDKIFRLCPSPILAWNFACKFSWLKFISSQSKQLWWKTFFLIFTLFYFLPRKICEKLSYVCTWHVWSKYACVSRGNQGLRLGWLLNKKHLVDKVWAKKSSYEHFYWCWSSLWNQIHFKAAPHMMCFYW